MSGHPSRAKAAWHQAFVVPGRAGKASAVLAVAAPPAAAAVLVPFRSDITNTALALVMVAVVVLVVSPGRRLAALAAGVSAGLWFDFFLTRPYESFAINRSADIQTTVLLFVVAVGIGELAARDRRHRIDSTSGTDGLAAVQAVSELLAEGAAAKPVIDAVRDALVPLLSLQSCHFDPSRAAVTVPFIERPGYVSYSVYRWDAAAEGLPPSLVTLAVRSGGRLLGRFVMEGSPLGVPIDAQRLLTALVLADLAGMALARSDRRWPAVPAREQTGVEVLRATGAE
jgi:K+-sensing histidine kinase KdpD